MQNIDRWKPTKFILKNAKLTASGNPNEVSVGSKLITNLVARCYQRALPKYVGGKLLDLGCGHVPLYEAYSPLIDENICVDWGNSLHKNSFLDFECDLSGRLPFPDGEFDTILLSDVLEHIPSPDALWLEMARVLADSGKIILNVPFLYWVHEAPHDYYRYTEYALRRFVVNSGLQLECIEPVGGVVEVIGDVLAKISAKVPLIGKHMSTLLQFSIFTFASTSYGQQLLSKSSRRFPLGYFLVASK